MNDLTSPIFDPMYAYPCFIPYITTLPSGEVEEFGLRSTGIEELDEHLDTMPIKVYITINRMIELFVDNYPVRIATPQAAKQIYEAIVKYSQLWSAYLKSHSLNQIRMPVEDLIIMEDFAARIRPFATEGVSPETIQLGLTNILDSYFLPTQNVILEHNNELLELFRDYQQRNR